MLPFHFATLFTDLAEMGYGESTKIQIAILVEQCVGEKINQDITLELFEATVKLMEDLDPKSLLENKVKNEKLKNKFVSPAEKI